MIYRKLYMDKICPYIDAPLIKILTGIRRCGKSTILEMIKEELHKRAVSEDQILSYRFDSLEYEEIDTASKLYKEIKSKLCPDKKTYIFLDEIQEVSEWEKTVNSLMADFNVDIYITGSNSRMMSSEISTYLTGRYVSFRVFPLSLAEYLDFRKAYSTTQDIYSVFKRYIQVGGFPALAQKDYSIAEVYTVIKDIYNSTIYTDIVKRNQIRKVDQLERIVKYTFDNVGQTFSALSISKYLKNEHRQMDSETIYNYLNKLENAYILHRCSRYDIKGKELLKTQEKFYLADPSFRFAVLGYNENMVASTLENIVYLELCRRGYTVNVGKIDNAEIDFVAAKDGEKIYIQIAQRIENEDTKKREYGNLLSIKDNYPKYVLRTDELTGGNYNGIKTMHIADFLLLENL